MSCCRFDPSQSILAGTDPATLQQWLTDAQAAMALLMTGKRLVSGSYNGMSVTYTQADLAYLTSWIQLLQAQMGIVCPKHALVPYFR